jgi:hypothetical protein
VAWLHGLGREQYEAFRENDVDAEILPKLTAEDLMPWGRLNRSSPKLLEAITALREEPTLSPVQLSGSQW